MNTRSMWSVQIEGKRQLVEEMWQFELSFKTQSSGALAPFSFVAGQFVSLHFHAGDDTFRRSYSIANTPEQFAQTGRLQLLVHCLPDGRGSQLLLNSPNNLVLELSGPFGQLLLPDVRPSRLLLIATGSGLAPYRSMLPQLIGWQKQGVSVQVLMGAKTPDSLFYREEFAALEAVGGQFTPCYSRVEQPPEGGRLGYVQDQLAIFGLNPEQDLVYLCGAPLMIDGCWQTLKALGFSVKQVKREKYTYSSH